MLKKGKIDNTGRHVFPKYMIIYKPPKIKRITLQNNKKFPQFICKEYVYMYDC